MAGWPSVEQHEGLPNGGVYFVCLSALGHPWHHVNFLVGRYRSLRKPGIGCHCLGRPLSRPPQYRLSCLLLRQDRCLLLRQDRCLLLRQDRNLLLRQTDVYKGDRALPCLNILHLSSLNSRHLFCRNRRHNSCWLAANSRPVIY